jgi:DNA-binding NarL/FixJ family response regulator
MFTEASRTSDRHEPERVLDAFKAGTDGCYSKRDPHKNIVLGIVEFLHGGSPISPIVARSIVSGLQCLGERIPENNDLSVREREVLRFLAKGLFYKENAAAMHIAETTVNDHLKHIYRKLNVHSRSEAIAKCVSGGGDVNVKSGLLKNPPRTRSAAVLKTSRAPQIEITERKRPPKIDGLFE